MRKTLAYMAVLTVIAASAQAATISWGAATWINDDTDVSTLGTELEAATPRGRNNETVNGVTFLKDGSPTHISVDGNAYARFVDDPHTPNITGSYLNIMKTGHWQATAINITGLTIGTNYLVQIWTCDGRASSGLGRNVDLIAGNTVTLQENKNDPNTTTLGQWVIGTFTADATTQDITLSGHNADGTYNADAQLINALQIRTVPEPATLGMVGLVGGLILFVRRRFMI